MAMFQVQSQLQHALAPTADEYLLELAQHQGPQALIWQSLPAIAVPRSYKRYAQLAHCQQHFAHQGWPIYVRQSGGGLVPQGKGIINLSLSWRQFGRPLDYADPAYELICTVIQKALRAQGISSSAQAVQGSFCDGRFNLAVSIDQDYKKIVGTAQRWRRCAPPTGATTTSVAGSAAAWHVALVHAVILLEVDELQLNSLANQVEHCLQSHKHYNATKIYSLHRLGLRPQAFLQALYDQLQLTAVPHDQVCPL